MLIRLASAPLQVDLAPAVGGSIARFDHVADGRVTPVLRGADGVPAGALDAGSFPLVPYCNRIRGGLFRFRGREVRLSRNMPTDASPLHGHGWLAPWDVVARSDDTAELLFRHEPGEWPWRYEARQHFRLRPDGLEIALACRNLSDEPMPCGLGQHPYFPCTAETMLDTEVATAWTIDAQVLPVDEVPAAGRYDLRKRRICGQHLDNGFGGWGGTARMDTPGVPFATKLSSPDARFFQLYSPAEGGLYVAEPVTHANAALNAPEQVWRELGIRVLAPGEEMRLGATIGVISGR
ncbi:aldose 1-epimerase [Sphingomonas sp. LY54]|uniref:aldose 1-epimerase n=1 Tax=Sphingomonas sp. LY54 TaxID=3095343 RepID=UPI002D76E02E|nr:aldose 1-epimerase [Sphingomonas sp. LY54]WRP28026.1 aldose 1-epimerase [Sphingomonas sp. LY54]